MGPLRSKLLSLGVMPRLGAGFTAANLLALMGLVVACSSSTSFNGPCPTIIVDAGGDASASIGVYLTEQECSKYCDSAHPICEFMNSTQLKCTAACE